MGGDPSSWEEKLAAIIPRPRINLVLYHGVLASHACWRWQAVSYGRPARDGNAREFEVSPRAADPTHAWTWPVLMRRVLVLDVLACPRCGDRLRVIATAWTLSPCGASSPIWPPPAPPRRPAPPHAPPLT